MAGGVDEVLAEYSCGLGSRWRPRSAQLEQALVDHEFFAVDGSFLNLYLVTSVPKLCVSQGSVRLKPAFNVLWRGTCGEPDLDAQILRIRVAEHLPCHTDKAYISRRGGSGMGYTEEQKDEIFSKGHPHGDRDELVWKKDDCGCPIKREDHGNTDSEYGWEIDHKDPSGGDEMKNLRPLQWEKNREKSDDPNYSC